MMQLRKFFFIVALMVVCVVAIAQDADKTALPNEADLVFSEVTADTEITRNQSPEVFSVGSILRLIISMFVVIGLLVLAMRFVKKAPRFKITESPYLKVVATTTVVPGKTVQVVTLGRKGYLIGTSESGLSLISEIDDQELIDAMNLEAEQNTDVPKRDFFTMLSPFFGGITKKSSTDFATKAFLQGERDRLQSVFSEQAEAESRDGEVQ